MSENLVWLVLGVAYASATVAYIKWRFDTIENESETTAPKQSKLDAPCINC